MQSPRQIVSTPSAPAAIGPYSQAVVSGDLAFTSGQIAIDPKTGVFEGGDVRAQTRRVLSNLEAVLLAAGSGLDRVLRCTVYLASIDDFAAMNEVYAEYFGESLPARSTIAARALPKGAAVEIDCIARR